jgi:hypothetical protein
MKITELNRLTKSFEKVTKGLQSTSPAVRQKAERLLADLHAESLTLFTPKKV